MQADAPSRPCRLRMNMHVIFSNEQRCRHRWRGAGTHQRLPQHALVVLRLRGIVDLGDGLQISMHRHRNVLQGVRRREIRREERESERRRSRWRPTASGGSLATGARSAPLASQRLFTAASAV